MYNKLHNKPWLIYGDGEQRRCFTVIENVLPCFAQCIFDEKTNNKTYNIGGLKDYSLNEIKEIMLELLGPHPIEYKESRLESKISISDHTKACQDLNYQEIIDLKLGLKQMWDWAQKLDDRRCLTIDNYGGFEIEKGVYSFWK
jgi:UDP-glucose 4-epimerase